MKFSTGISIIILIIFLVSAGCTTMQNLGTSPVSATGVPKTDTIIAPTVTFTSELPPDSLAMGKYSSFGLGEKTGKVTVLRYALGDKYEWGNTFWGNNYFNATPKEGNKFLILFIQFTNPSTQPIPAPSPALFTVVSNGTTYYYSSVDDPTLWIKGTDKKQLDYEVKEIRRDGYLNADPTTVIEGFLIYEVPATFTQGYVDATFNGRNRVMWKIA